MHDSREHPDSQPASRLTQRDRILEILRNANGDWIPATRLADVSLQYSARISELRQLGHRIINRVRTVDGRKFGYFALKTARSQGALFED